MEPIPDGAGAATYRSWTSASGSKRFQHAHNLPAPISPAPEYPAPSCKPKSCTCRWVNGKPAHSNIPGISESLALGSPSYLAGSWPRSRLIDA
ncbi:hypothetical protein AVEN_100969-1 [Araneus ventricosus]|uniref:Uncharacterized protein n=1 Tax=Araneus ventricosus TaxID=182803 RepID=A0A4Y2WY36_ARAVE|nr:hypothetical protein AVEN_100969-1 [Araneus ventricosus]